MCCLCICTYNCVCGYIIHSVQQARDLMKSVYKNDKKSEMKINQVKEYINNN